MIEITKNTNMSVAIAKKFLIIATMQVGLIGASAALPVTVSAVKDKTTGIDCSKTDCSDPAADPKAKCNRDGCDLVDKYINPTIKLLSGIVGLIAAISLIAGGIQYSAAGGDPQKISAAKNRISKTILALVAYMFLFAFLQFIVPGGVFR